MFKKEESCFIIILSIALFLPCMVLAQNPDCLGVQARTATCLDYKGQPTTDNYCTDNGLPKPATEQTCDYTCPPPSPTVVQGFNSDGSSCAQIWGKSCQTQFDTGVSYAPPGWVSPLSQAEVDVYLEKYPEYRPPQWYLDLFDNNEL